MAISAPDAVGRSKEVVMVQWRRSSSGRAGLLVVTQVPSMRPMVRVLRALRSGPANTSRSPWDGPRGAKSRRRCSVSGAITVMVRAESMAEADREDQQPGQEAEDAGRPR